MKFKHSNNPISRNIAVLQASLSGFIYAIKTDNGVKQWSIICPILCVLAFYFGETKNEKVILFLCAGLIYITEIINTAIETTLDRITKDFDLEVKHAKDLGSFAVFITVIFTTIIWSYLLIL